MRRNSIQLLNAILLMVLVFSWGTRLDAQEETCHPFCPGEPGSELLSPDPKEFFADGLSAARQGDYRKAITDFDITLDKDPGNLMALFNRALAESKVPGLELSAAADSYAYLAAAPWSDDADKVRQLAEGLTGRAREVISQLAGTEQQLAQYISNPILKTTALAYASEIRAMGGDFAAARELAVALPAEPSDAMPPNPRAAMLAKIQEMELQQSGCGWRTKERVPSLPALGSRDLLPEGVFDPKWRKSRMGYWHTRNLIVGGSYLEGLGQQLRSIAASNVNNISDILVWLRSVAENIAQALNDLDQLRGDEAHLLQVQGLLYEQKGDLDLAKQLYDTSGRLCPNHPELAKMLDSYQGSIAAAQGWSALAEGDAERAAMQFTSCLQHRRIRCVGELCVEAPNSDCFMGRGGALFVQQKYEFARSDFRRSDPFQYNSVDGISGPKPFVDYLFTGAEIHADRAAYKIFDSDLGTLWQFLCEAHAGDNPQNNRSRREDLERTLVGKLYLGEISSAQFLAQRTQADQDSLDSPAGKCAAYFHLAENALLRNQNAEAKRYFLKELEQTADCEDSLEYIVAPLEMRRALAPAAPR